MSSIAMRRAEQLSPTIPRHLRALFGRMARFADDNGDNCYPSNQTLAAGTDVTVRTVKRQKRQLEALGHLILEGVSGARGGRKRTNRYRLRLELEGAVSGERTGGLDAGPLIQNPRAGAPRASREAGWGYSDRVRSLALRAAEAANMTVAVSEGNFATAARWIAALDEAGMPDQLVLRVITDCRAQSRAKLASYLSFYTPPVMRELARVKVDTPEAAAPPPSLARPKPSEPAMHSLTIKAMACNAMDWAKLEREPRPAELGEVQGWRSRAASLSLTDAETVDLMRGVIELIADREHGTVPPTSLHYFGRPMRDALDAMSRHRVTAVPEAGAPPKSAAAPPVKEGTASPVKGDTVSPNPSVSLNQKGSGSGGSSSGPTPIPAGAGARGSGARPLGAAEERLLWNGSGGAVPSSVARTALAPAVPQPSSRPIGARQAEALAIVAEAGKALRIGRAPVAPPVEVQRAALEDRNRPGTRA